MAAVLLLAAAATGIALLGGGADEPLLDRAGPEQTPSAERSTPRESADSSAPRTDDGESSSPQDATAPPGTTARPDRTAPAPAAGASREQFVDDYFDTVPADLDAGWQLLSPRMQAEVGRDSFDSFWEQMADVDAASVRTEGGVVDAAVTYTYDSGRVVRQQNQYELVRTADGFLIDDETVISSTTVSE